MSSFVLNAPERSSKTKTVKELLDLITWRSRVTDWCNLHGPVGQGPSQRRLKIEIRWGRKWKKAVKQNHYELEQRYNGDAGMKDSLDFFEERRNYSMIVRQWEYAVEKEKLMVLEKENNYGREISISPVEMRFSK